MIQGFHLINRLKLVNIFESIKMLVLHTVRYIRHTYGTRYKIYTSLIYMAKMKMLMIIYVKLYVKCDMISN